MKIEVCFSICKLLHSTDVPAKTLERVGESLCLGAVFDDGCLVVSCQPPALDRFVVFWSFFLSDIYS